MDILTNKSDQQILQSIIAESAKSTNELKCALGDIDKALNRLAFVLVMANELLDRQVK